MAKVLLKVRHEAWYYELVYSKLLEVGECGKVTQGPSVKLFRSEGNVDCAVTEPLDERKQTEVGCVLERPSPCGFLGKRGVDREGVVKMGDSCDVPRVANAGTYVEGGEFIHEVGDDQFYEFPWKPGDWALWNPDDWTLWNPSEWGRGRGGHLGPPEQLIDLVLALPPDLGSE